MPASTDFHSQTPGDLLREQVVGRLGITQDQLADALGVSRYSVNQLINDRRAITAEMALRLSVVLGTTAEFWLELQMGVDLERARRRLGADVSTLKVLKSEVRPPVSLDELVA